MGHWQFRLAMRDECSILQSAYATSYPSFG
jgi:hypothetical protein